MRSTGTRCFIMSGKRDPERFLKGARERWPVENSLHRVLDVTMNEDHPRNRTGPGPEKPDVMRRPALNPARVTKDRQAESMRGELKKAGRDHRCALKLISSAGLLPENGKSQKRQPWFSMISNRFHGLSASFLRIWVSLGVLIRTSPQARFRRVVSFPKGIRLHNAALTGRCHSDRKMIHRSNSEMHRFICRPRLRQIYMLYAGQAGAILSMMKTEGIACRRALTA